MSGAPPSARWRGARGAVLIVNIPQNLSEARMRFLNNNFWLVLVEPEFYFDLSYDDEGSLILKRANQGANLEDTKKRLAHFLENSEVLSENNKPVELEARSICLHGDGPNAVELALTISDGLATAGYTLQPLKSENFDSKQS